MDLDEQLRMDLDEQVSQIGAAQELRHNTVSRQEVECGIALVVAQKRKRGLQLDEDDEMMEQERDCVFRSPPDLVDDWLHKLTAIFNSTCPSVLLRPSAPTQPVQQFHLMQPNELLLAVRPLNPAPEPSFP